MNPTSYHHNLLVDHERLAGFKEIIEKKSHGIVYDLGTGSGILACWAAPNAEYVYAVEKDPRIAEIAKSNLSHLKNVTVLVDDALDLRFPSRADLIICEMIDTALIDEEQVPVLNNALKYIKKNGDVIPTAVLNGIELLNLKSEYIRYQETEDPQITVMSPLKIYSQINFLENIQESVDIKINLQNTKKGLVSGIRLTTFTLFSPHLICGPTKMLNPPLLVPLTPRKLELREEINIKLTYQMGGGLNTLKAGII
jgi:predicted RNA methylase